MNFLDIDELFKKAILEDEKKQDLQAFQSQQKVWDRIEKPKHTREIPWLYISTLAAAISLFLISTILYLKLDSAESKLMALKEEGKAVVIEIPSKETADYSQDIVEENMQSALPVETPVASLLAPDIEVTAVGETSGFLPSQEVEIEKNIAVLAATEAYVEVGKRPPLMDPEFESHPIFPEQEQLYARSKEEPEKRVKSNKVKIRIGAGASDSFSQNSFALNLKLKN